MVQYMGMPDDFTTLGGGGGGLGCTCVVVFLYVSLNMRVRPGKGEREKGNVHRLIHIFKNNPGDANLINVFVSSSTSHNGLCFRPVNGERGKGKHSSTHPHTIHKQSWIRKSNLRIFEFFF